MLSGRKNQIGYAFLSIGIVVGLFFGYRVDQGQQHILSNQRKFIIKQCDANQFERNVIKEALEDARRRAITSLVNDPLKQAHEVRQIQETINRLDHAPPCIVPE